MHFNQKLTGSKRVSQRAVTLIELTAGLSILCLTAVLMLSADLSFLFSTDNAKNAYRDVNILSEYLTQDLSNLVFESDRSSVCLTETGSLEINSNTDSGTKKITWLFKDDSVIRDNMVFHPSFTCRVSAQKGSRLYNNWKNKRSNPKALVLELKNNRKKFRLFFNIITDSFGETG
jgi:hypothetical protein